MSFDAGSVVASLTLDTAKFDRDLSAAKAKLDELTRNREIKISAVFDSASLSKARKMFADLDNMISRDAAQRLKSSPQGSVLGALNSLFSPHPVTGAPSPASSAQGGLLGKMVSQQGGGGPVGNEGNAGSAGRGGASTTTNAVRDLLTGPQPGNVSTEDQIKQVLTGTGASDQQTTDQIKQMLTGTGASDVTTTDKIKQMLTGTAPGNVNTEDLIKQTLTGAAPSNVNTEDLIKQVVTGPKPGDVTTKDVVKEALDPASKAKVIADSGDTGDKAGSLFSRLFSGHVDVLLASFKSRMGSSGSSGGAAMGTGILGGIGPGITGVSAKMGLMVTGIGTALAALPALAGIIGVGMGVAMIGGLVAAVVMNTPALKAQFAGIGADAKQMLTTIGAPIVPALKAAFAQIPALLKSITGPLTQVMKTVAPQIAGVFAGLTPIIRGLVGIMQAAAPAFGPVLEGLEKLVANILPGIQIVIKAMVPFLGQFAGILATLGSHLGQFFSAAAPAIGASMKVLGTLLDVVGALLPIIVKLGGVFATALVPVLTALAGVVKALMPTLTLIGQVLAALAQAVLGDLVSAFGALAQLVIAISPSFNILAKALESVFNVLENSGVFAVLGDALEAIVPSLAKLINLIVAQFAPILPVVIGLVSTLAGIFVTVMAAGLTVILGGITKLVQTFPFLVPLIAAVVAVTWLWNAALAANPIGAVIIAIVALIGGIDLLVTHWTAVWTTIKQVAGDVGTFLENLFNNQIVQAILAIWSAGLIPLAEHWTAVWGAIQTTAEGFWNWLSQTFGTDLSGFFTRTIPGWLSELTGDVTSWAGNVKNAFLGVWDWLSGTLGPDFDHFFTSTLPGYWTDFYDAVVRTGDSVISWMGALPGKITGALGNLGGLLLSDGEAILTGLWDGLKDIWNSVVSWFKAIPGDILSALGIHSAPAWAVQAGKDILGGIVTGMEATADKVIHAAEAAAAKAAAALGKYAGGGGGAQPPTSASGVVALMQKMAAARGWTGLQWSDLYNVEMAEAGFNVTATNPSSGAYGLAQFINGPSEYAQYGGNSSTAAGQITGMLNYIAQRYGDPEAAWAHEQAYHWYGSGGMITEPVIGFGARSGDRYMFGESGPEMVTPVTPGMGSRLYQGDQLDKIIYHLQKLIAVTAAVPAGVGNQVGGAIGGASQAASFRVRYPRGGS